MTQLNALPVILFAVVIPTSGIAGEAYMPQVVNAAMRDAKGSLAMSEAALARLALTANRVLPAQSGPQAPNSSGAETVSTLIQVGTGNSAVIVQMGAANRSFSIQQGQGNNARVHQSR
ncbi:hypothetical protein [Bosea sp. 47.2.35]|uniref:hypothetical protein n=1 Tax=Bosea sp. 47.2.35 TaxID=2969304 RepID=UPI00215055A0|nr:hypothetical protein [Bosea sp. 47.2.35]MCR4524333.1 hypothetical protein [Bosea sp. 47.2.35]